MGSDEIFVLSIIGIVMTMIVAVVWIKARFGGRAATAGELAADRKVELLSRENQRLTDQVVRLQDRIGVLERIVTDPADRTARAIEALREEQEVR